MEHIHIYVAGHARQNNGHAGIGLCFYTDPKNKPFYEEGEYIGIETQNSAVYRAILRALTKAMDWQLKTITIYTDNRLVVSQLIENMSARAQNIIPLYGEVKKLIESVKVCSVHYVSSAANKRPKELARASAIASPETVTAQALQFEVQPGITGLILAFSPKMMLVQYKYKRGSKINTVKYQQAQSNYLINGSLKYFIAEQDIIMKKGSALVINADTPYKVEALEDSTEIVTYSPMRMDLLKIS